MSLSTIARSKLSLSSSNLHRWVLLKNSILASKEDSAAFMFPACYSYEDDTQTKSSEALWLDTLLESLAHDEEDDDEDPPIEEEEEDDDDDEIEEDADLLSPMSSSDDLSQHPFMRYYPVSPIPIALPFPFADLDVLDDSIDFSSDDDSDPLKCSSCSSSTSSTSPSSSASSLPPSTPPPSPLRSWAPVPKFPLPPLPPTPYIDAYSDPLPFPHTFTYDIQSPFVFHSC